MKQITGFLLLVVLTLGMSGCFNTTIPKPEQLIPKDKFIKMMVDVYLVQGLKVVTPDEQEAQRITQTDLYYSVLKKYSVADTVFIRSLIYYSSFPKDYEKMHVQIMDILNETELKFKPQEKLNLDKR